MGHKTISGTQIRDLQIVHLQTKAFLFTRSALCADRPRSRGGFLRIKLVARFDLGVPVVAEVVLGDATGIVLQSSLALRENTVPLGVTAEQKNNIKSG